MNSNLLQQKEYPLEMLELQQVQHMDSIPLTAIVPALAAGGTAYASVSVGSHGAFRALKVMGKFSTLYEDPGQAGAVTDDGVCHLTGKLSDQNANLPMFADFASLDLWLTPGRVRRGGVALPFPAGGVIAPSNPLNIPMLLDYIFAPNNTIGLELKNDSNTAQYVEIVLWGRRLKDTASKRTARNFR
jgi:hypothetical protein